jgi:hypothetical protein
MIVGNDVSNDIGNDMIVGNDVGNNIGNDIGNYYYTKFCNTVQLLNLFFLDMLKVVQQLQSPSSTAINGVRDYKYRQR